MLLRERIPLPSLGAADIARRARSQARAGALAGIVYAASTAAAMEIRLVKMFLVSAKGGTSVPFRPEFSVAGIAAGSAPVWSPDGRYLTFNGRGADDRGSLVWWVAPAAGGPAIRTDAHRNLSLVPNWQSPYAWEGSHVYFSTGSSDEGVNIFRKHFGDGRKHGQHLPGNAGEEIDQRSRPVA